MCGHVLGEGRRPRGCCRGHAGSSSPSSLKAVRPGHNTLQGAAPPPHLWGRPCGARGARTLYGPSCWLLPICVLGSRQDTAAGPRSPHVAPGQQPPSSHASPHPDGCHLSPSDTAGPGYPRPPPQLPASLPSPGPAIPIVSPTRVGPKDITAPPGPRSACWASGEPRGCSCSQAWSCQPPPGRGLAPRPGTTPPPSVRGWGDPPSGPPGTLRLGAQPQTQEMSGECGDEIVWLEYDQD